MKIVDTFPYRVRETANCFIELGSGVRLAARMWLPETECPVPAILEYLPYRKGDVTAIDDAARHGYFAGHGFASVRVDMRGSGDSDGVLLDEYSAIELSDAVEVIEWLAAQTWCNGRVGMTGISWGGFNALQVAALAPPALRAVITACSTDDRYADDVHYQGGAVLAREMLGWAMTFLAFNARPPDPQTVGERWREMWQQRLDATPAFIDTWMAHPQRDDYWRHGSVCENYAAIRAPVLIVGGWADGYTNAVLRLLDGLTAPARAIIGPWSHHWPHAGAPGPTIGFLAEAVRWWDHWLKDRDRGVLAEPRLRFWQQEHTAPRPKRWPGTWIGTNLASGDLDVRYFYIGEAGALADSPAPDARLTIPTDPAHGAAAGMWCPFGPNDLAPDQHEDDARCLCFDSAPFADAVALLGRPVLTVGIEHATAGAQIVARLCEVAADGSSLLLSWGVAVVGTDKSVRLPFNVLGHRLRPGHRLRVALAGSYWPVVWPAPHSNATSIRSGDVRLELPIWRGTSLPVTFGEPECAPPAAYTVLRKGSLTAPTTTSRRADHGRIRHANGIEVDTVAVDDMPWSGGAAAARFTRTIEIARGDWRTCVEVVGEMTDAAGGFDITVALTAALNDEACADRHWRFRFERGSG
jgi:putative CocE/NonD family hydrolase